MDYVSNLFKPTTEKVFNFYPNMSTLHLGLCYCKSICLSSVCNVRAPYSGGWTFQHIPLLLCALATLWPLCEILRRSSQGSPSVWGIKCKRGSKIERWWTYRRLYLI